MEAFKEDCDTDERKFERRILNKIFWNLCTIQKYSNDISQKYKIVTNVQACIPNGNISPFAKPIAMNFIVFYIRANTNVCFAPKVALYTIPFIFITRNQTNHFCSKTCEWTNIFSSGEILWKFGVVINIKILYHS